MDATELRKVLDRGIAELVINKGYKIGGGSIQDSGSNRALSHYNYVNFKFEEAGKLLNKKKKLTISEGTADACDGFYVGDLENTCTYKEVDANTSIVVSGKFSGCTLVLCKTKDSIAIGHLYVNSKNVSNDPDAQLKALTDVTGGSIMSQLTTSGKTIIKNTPTEVVVFGTRVGESWVWYWVAVAGMSTNVVTCRRINVNEWE